MGKYNVFVGILHFSLHVKRGFWLKIAFFGEKLNNLYKPSVIRNCGVTSELDMITRGIERL